MSPCTVPAPGVIVCTSPYVRAALYCGTCNRKRPMAGVFGLWRGYSLTCIGCGERWFDEGRGHRPFERGWRQESITRAVETWRAATRTLRQETRRQHEQEMAEMP